MIDIHKSIVYSPEDMVCELANVNLCNGINVGKFHSLIYQKNSLPDPLQELQHEFSIITIWIESSLPLPPPTPKGLQ